MNMLIALLAAVHVACASTPRSSLPCNIDRLSRDLDPEVTLARFRSDYIGKLPVIAELRRDRNVKFRSLTERDSLLESYGHLPVELSTANSFTGRAWEKLTLAAYMQHMMAAQTAERGGNSTWYFFGNTYGAEWEAMLAEYEEPPLAESAGTGLASANGATSYGTAVSFGLAGKESGVPFHLHSDGWSEVLHGAKRWFLFPPGYDVGHDPNASTLQWSTAPDGYGAHIDREDISAQIMRECVIWPGDALYFPPNWPHATLNLGEYNAFASTFL